MKLLEPHNKLPESFKCSDKRLTTPLGAELALLEDTRDPSRVLPSPSSQPGSAEGRTEPHYGPNARNGNSSGCHSLRIDSGPNGISSPLWQEDLLKQLNDAHEENQELRAQLARARDEIADLGCKVLPTMFILPAIKLFSKDKLDVGCSGLKDFSVSLHSRTRVRGSDT